MQTIPDDHQPDDDDQLPRGPGDKLIIRISSVLLVLLVVFIWVDTPTDAPTDERSYSWFFLRFAITVAIGGGLFFWWRKNRRDGK